MILFDNYNVIILGNGWNILLGVIFFYVVWLSSKLNNDIRYEGMSY